MRIFFSAREIVLLLQAKKCLFVLFSSCCLCFSPPDNALHILPLRTPAILQALLTIPILAKKSFLFLHNVLRNSFPQKNFSS